MEFCGIEIKKKETVNGMEVYEEEKQTENNKGVLKKLWERTIFPDIIKSKREEKEFKRQITEEAKKEVRQELKEEMKKKIKQDEMDKLTGKKKGSNFLGKLGEEFASMGRAAGSKDIGAMMGGKRSSEKSILGDDKIKKMLSMESTKTDKTDNLSLGGIASDEKINRMLGKKSKKEKQEKIDNFEDKIKRMIG
jgi:hypothetical protein